MQICYGENESLFSYYRLIATLLPPYRCQSLTLLELLRLTRPELDQLSQEFLELWLEQVEIWTREGTHQPQLQANAIEFFKMMVAQMPTAAPTSTGNPTTANDRTNTTAANRAAPQGTHHDHSATTAPPSAATTLQSAPARGDEQFERLHLRLAAIEERLATLESRNSGAHDKP